MLCHASVGEGDLAFYPTIWYTEKLPTGQKKMPVSNSWFSISIRAHEAKLANGY